MSLGSPNTNGIVFFLGAGQQRRTPGTGNCMKIKKDSWPQPMKCCLPNSKSVGLRVFYDVPSRFTASSSASMFCPLLRQVGVFVKAKDPRRRHQGQVADVFQMLLAQPVFLVNFTQSLQSGKTTTLKFGTSTKPMGHFQYLFAQGLPQNDRQAVNTPKTHSKLIIYFNKNVWKGVTRTLNN